MSYEHGATRDQARDFINLNLTYDITFLPQPPTYVTTQPPSAKQLTKHRDWRSKPSTKVRGRLTDQISVGGTEVNYHEERRGLGLYGTYGPTQTYLWWRGNMASWMQQGLTLCCTYQLQPAPLLVR